MNKLDLYKLITLLAAALLVLSACGNATADDTIATAVAMTVAAQNTEAAAPTKTPVETGSGSTSTPDAAATKTQLSTPTTAPPPPAVDGVPCLRANLVGETIPDGTLFKPGETFLKTWRIQNNGSCTWNSSYKIVFWDGDLMGGLLEYDFPGETRPGEIADISLFLKSPETNGSYKGYWKLVSEWGGAFGVGEYDAAFYVQINVNDSDKIDYGITSVTYNIVRDPITGCSGRIWYTVYATVTSNGPVTISYRWLQSDGNHSKISTYKFNEAGTKVFKRQWSLGVGDATNPRWFEFVTTEPIQQSWGQATFHFTCQ
ncbi:MAG: hypothetical protein Kow002_15740 [Anaerolineales bacterium]